MPALVTIDDVEVRLGRTITPAEEPRVAALIEDASAAIVEAAKQEILESTSTEWVESCTGTFRLRQGPVKSVSGAVDTNGAAVPIVWHYGATFTATATGPLAVTYTHGYQTTPAALAAVCAQMVGRALGVAPDQTGKTQESLGPYAYTVGSAAAAGAVGMLPTELRIVESFAPAAANQAGTIQVGVSPWL